MRSTFSMMGLLLVGMALLAPAPLRAEEQKARLASDWVITRTQLNKTECTCRLKGDNIPVGSEVCMQNSMFRCQMNQNVTTWQPLSTPCPTS